MLTHILLGVCVFLLIANFGVQVARMVGPKSETVPPKSPPLQVTSWKVTQQVELPGSVCLTYRVVLSDQTIWEGGRDGSQNWWRNSATADTPDVPHAKILEEFLNERENTLYVNATRAV